MTNNNLDQLRQLIRNRKIVVEVMWNTHEKVNYLEGTNLIESYIIDNIFENENDRNNFILTVKAAIDFADTYTGPKNLNY